MSFIVRSQDLKTSEIFTREYGAEIDAVRNWNSAELYVNTTPLSVTTDALEAAGIVVDADDVKTRHGGFEVDGMPLDQWAYHMTMD